ncbi:SLAP domain-containing protein [Companilactobacillus zhachilii]|uniref:SLAP domain-containing protein n=1 Tax=Companilactobacillus zhachilii TaxID=2304606 RepID=UPI0019218480|nr:SLAP domain-containing protein [Companilactobacillus zhachilii]MBL3530702.1 SLAP domain-containing protein [Companilactobacillus zhachilii]
MKKSTSLLLSGMLVSGMVLGTIVTPATVHASDDAAAVTQADTDVVNNVTYFDRSGATVGANSTKVTGTKGAKITAVPDGYALADGETAVFGNDNANVGVKVTPMISAKVNFVDQKGNLVKSETVNGGDGNAYTLSTLPNGCSWPADANKTITLEQGKEYNVKVNRQVTNTIIFKTADNSEAGRTQVFGEKAGDTVTLTADQIPAGYTVDSNDLTLQSDGNTQFIAVTKNVEGITPFTATVRVGSSATTLYTVNGKAITNRLLAPGSDWKTANKLVLNGKAYYQVATTEWVPADKVTVVSQTDNNTDTNSTVEKADRKTVTTKNVAYTPLYDGNGKEVTNRGLGASSDWATDQMQTINNVKYYRVATNEWLKASDIA